MGKPSIHTGRTNESRRFRPGDIILAGDTIFEVTENWGIERKARFYPPNPGKPDAFTLRWHDEDRWLRASMLLIPAEDRPDLDP